MDKKLKDLASQASREKNAFHWSFFYSPKSGWIDEKLREKSVEKMGKPIESPRRGA